MNQCDVAYIAGFLDGDGSIMLQLHRRNSGKEVFRIKQLSVYTKITDTAMSLNQSKKYWVVDMYIPEMIIYVSCE